MGIDHTAWVGYGIEVAGTEGDDIYDMARDYGLTLARAGCSYSGDVVDYLVESATYTEHEDRGGGATMLTALPEAGEAAALNMLPREPAWFVGHHIW